MRKIAVLLSFLLFLVTIISCASGEAELPNNEFPPPAYKDDNSVIISVYADNAFSPIQKLMIIDTFRRWSDKTDYIIIYDLRFVETRFLKRTTQDKNTYYVYARPPDNPGYVGWAQWSFSIHGCVTDIKNNLSDDTFIKVALHEIGHCNGSDHHIGPYKSIMKPVVGEADDITCQDLIDFCINWKCEIKCIQELSTESTVVKQQQSINSIPNICSPETINSY